MDSKEFVKTVSDAVDAFLHDPKLAGDTPGRENILDDPELAAAAKAGFESNPVAQTYASGYAAGHAAAMEESAAEGTGRAALTGLREWIENRRARFAAGSLDLDDLVAEIDARLAGDGEAL